MNKLLLILTLNCLPFVFIAFSIYASSNEPEDSRKTLQQWLPLDAICESIQSPPSP
ncbi:MULTISPECIES: hypothetical protein [Photobacterium]|uniref:hypothetical protein n=1 Tax=Photobacterium TaxID=657 RepID=UPI000B021D28|nr:MULTISPECIES: hypothetical protein [Photobacterium]MBV1842079.1 hypothetical protein [Photobacterium ganghwense]QSV13036.1 hypothetical protein FH974_09745 [Photobacterium ganghwense]